MKPLLEDQFSQFPQVWQSLTGGMGYIWHADAAQHVPQELAQAALSVENSIDKILLEDSAFWLAQIPNGEQPFYLAGEAVHPNAESFFVWTHQLLSSFQEENLLNTQLTDELISAWDRLNFMFELAWTASLHSNLEDLSTAIVRLFKNVITAEEIFIICRRGKDVQLFSNDKTPQTNLKKILDIQMPIKQVTFWQANKKYPQSLEPLNLKWDNLAVIPLQFSGSISGLLGLRNYPDSELSAGDKNLLISVADQFAAMLDAAVIHEEHDHAQRLERELHIATQIQRSMLPRVLPEIPGFEFGSLLKSAYQVGGDFYDVQVSGDHIAVMVGDVAGKGIPAAMLTTLMHSVFSTTVQHVQQVEQALEAINRQVFEDIERAETFITAALIFIDPVERTVSYASAGHTTSLLLRYNDQQILNMPSTGLPLGIFQDASYQTQQFDLKLGDVLLLYSDGVTEAEDENGHVMGYQGLIDVLTAVYPVSAAQQIASIQQAVNIHAGNTPLKDDMVMFLVRLLSGIPSLQITPFVFPSERHTARVISLLVRQCADQLRFTAPRQRILFLDELELAISEIITNIVLHAYKDRHGRIQGRITTYPDRVSIDLIDSGHMFEPKGQPREFNIDDPPVGGYGMGLANKLLHVCDYTRLAGQRNHWYLEKKVS